MTFSIQMFSNLLCCYFAFFWHFCENCSFVFEAFHQTLTRILQCDSHYYTIILLLATEPVVTSTYNELIITNCRESEMESSKKKIVVFTGAGISAESGLATFRDKKGLWKQQHLEDLATKQAWEYDPERVLAFYNHRIAKANAAKPNAAHHAIAELERYFDVSVITQNVDDLHERAGSTNVIHLHGRLNFAQSSLDASVVYPWHGKPILIGQRCEFNCQLRPNVVLFGEPVLNLDEARTLISDADKVLAIGSSLTVQPAAGLLNEASVQAEKVLITKEVKTKPLGYTFISGNASTCVPRQCSDWLREVVAQ